MSLFLVGLRGSGKTTVGRVLAQRLALPLVDTDALIVQAAGISIREIFASQGEAVFRDLESQALEHLIAGGSCVAATGGGIVLREKNRRMIQTTGWPVIYLSAPADLLARRVHADSATALNRPNLTDLGGGVAEMEHLLKQRDPLYRQIATWIVDAQAPADRIADQIENLLLQHKTHADENREEMRDE